MRRFEPVFELESIPIEDVELPFDRRVTSLVNLLAGLQYLWSDADSRARLKAIMSAYPLSPTRRTDGRPGMPLWRVLVLAVMKESMNYCYDELLFQANQVPVVRLILGHAPRDPFAYARQTLIDNVDALPAPALAEINQLLADAGDRLAGKKSGAGVWARGDSFVVKTNVHYPIDVRQLTNALKSSMLGLKGMGKKLKETRWRQAQHHVDNLRALGRAFWTSRQQDDLIAYLECAWGLFGEIRATHRAWAGRLPPGWKTVAKVARWIELAEKLVHQVRRRCLHGLPTPHQDKILSVYEEHTRWIAKGKAGVPAELGVPCTIIQDEFGFIRHWSLQWDGTDVDDAVPAVEAALRKHPDLIGCSFDRGYWSPTNFARLSELLKHPILPVKGGGTATSRAREAEPGFRAQCRWHAGIESAIHELQSHGLGRVRRRGRQGFANTVAIAVIAFNLQRVGQLARKRRAQYASRRHRRVCHVPDWMVPALS